MKIWTITLSLILSSFLFVSCNNAESTISDLKDIVAEVDQLPEDCTEEDLQKITAKYEEVSKNLEKYEYTDDQTKEIGKLKGQYVAKMTKASMKTAAKSLKNFGKKLENGVKGFMKEMEEE